jgi:uncharacterized protein YlzI (FlbEa/FlbD family)
MKEYDYVSAYKNGFAKVLLNGKCGFINKNGEEICECKYDFVSDFDKKFAVIELNGKYGFINDIGIEIIPCDYSFGDAQKLLEKYKLNQIRIAKLKTIC